jgi:hypothetical protein
MIKELSIKEIATCCGGVRMVERTNGVVEAAFSGVGAVFLQVMIMLFMFARYNRPAYDYECHLLCVGAAVSFIATFYNSYGSKYMIDLDAPPERVDAECC